MAINNIKTQQGVDPSARASASPGLAPDFATRFSNGISNAFLNVSGGFFAASNVMNLMMMDPAERKPFFARASEILAQRTTVTGQPLWSAKQSALAQALGEAPRT